MYNRDYLYGGPVLTPVDQWSKNPYSAQPNVRQPIQTNSDIVWVQGEEAARIYPVAPSRKLILFDSEAPVLYAKQTDYDGRPMPMRIFDLVERKSEPNAKGSVDYDYLRKMVNEEIDARMSKSNRPKHRKDTLIKEVNANE